MIDIVFECALKEWKALLLNTMHGSKLANNSIVVILLGNLILICFSLCAVIHQLQHIYFEASC